MAGHVYVGNSFLEREVVTREGGLCETWRSVTPGTVSVVDVQRALVETTIAVGMAPVDVAVAPGERFGVVANYHDGTLSVLESRRVVQTVPAVLDPPPLDKEPLRPYALAMHPDGTRVYVLAEGPPITSALFMLDLDTLEPRVTFPRYALNPWHSRIAVHPDGRRVYVSDRNLYVLDRDCHQQSYVKGGPPGAMALHPDGSLLYVCDEASRWLLVYDAASLVLRHRVAVGERAFASRESRSNSHPKAVAVHPDGDTVFVTTGRDGALSVVDGRRHELTRIVRTGEAARGVAVDRDLVYVTNAGDDTLSILSASDLTVTATVGVGRRPLSLSLAPR